MLHLLDLIKWRYDEWMGYNNEDLTILAKKNKAVLVRKGENNGDY